MIRLKNKYASDISRSRKRLQEVYALKNEHPAIYICDAPWWLFGELPETIPEGYCEGNFEIMLKHQINKIDEHFNRAWDDCMEPVLAPWYGTGVLASAFGVEIVIHPGQDPAAGISTVESPDFILNMKQINPHRDGQMPIVLDTIDYFKKNSDLDITLTDCQGPLTSAFNIIGYENFIYWTMDYPDMVHLLMQKVTDALIVWVRAQKDAVGMPYDEPFSLMNIRPLDGKGGIIFSDDDAVLLSAEMYAEFAKPYNEQLLAAFDGGAIHCCGNVAHQKENLKNTKGLTLYHNMLLADFVGASATQQALAEQGIVYVAGDFAPSDDFIDTYYAQLAKYLAPEGLIVAPYIAPATALVGGRYESVERDVFSVAKHCRDAIYKYFDM